MANLKAIKIKVRDTEHILFEGEVERISSFNEVGPFDIYPTHANFISIINQKLSLYHNKEKIKELDVEQAIMKIKNDTVHIFLGIETFQIDEETETNPPVTPVKK
jgi:F0F1-type ATP synthase epsilon subunit